MHALWLESESGQHHLWGAGAAQVVKAVQRSTKTCPEGGALEQVAVRLEGLPGDLLAWLQLLERALERIGREETLLALHPAAGEEVWRAWLEQGWLNLAAEGGDERSAGWMQVIIHFMRPGCWEGEESELPLSNANGQRVLGGLTIWNHADGHNGHTPVVAIAGADVVGGRPAPVRLVIHNDLDSACTVGTLRIARQTCLQAPLVLEGEAAVVEDGAGGEIVSESGSSQGAHLRLVVPAGGEAAVLRWELPGTLLEGFTAGAMLPVLRLAESVEGSGLLQAAVKISVGKQSVVSAGQTGWRLLKRGEEMHDLAAFHLPSPPGYSLLPDFNLHLLVQSINGEAFTLDVDYLVVLQGGCSQRLEAWYELGEGWELHAGGVRGDACGWHAEKGWLRGHTAAGAALTLLPGLDQYLLILNSAQRGALPADRFRVQAFYRPRMQEV